MSETPAAANLSAVDEFVADADAAAASDEADVATFELRQFVVGPLQTNCYALVSSVPRADGLRPCLVVDPGAAGERIAEALSDVAVELVVATHGHADHVSGAAELCAATGAPFTMCAADVEQATHVAEWSSHGFASNRDAPAPDRLLAEGDVVEVGGFRLRVIETPGHTPGCIVLVGEEGSEAEGLAFVGDTLFAGSVGRTDLRGGDANVQRESLRRLVAELAPETFVLSGHGDATTMEVELATNPFLQNL